MRHCFAQCWRQSRVNRVDVYPLWLQFWLRASMLQQIGVTCGCECKYGCKWKVWKLPPPVLWRCRWWRGCCWYCSGLTLTESEALVLLELHQPVTMLQSLLQVRDIYCKQILYLFAVYATISSAAASHPLNCIPFPHSNGHAPNKIKDKEPNNCILGCKSKESYYDPRICVFVMLLSLCVKCLVPSFAVDGTKHLLTSLNYKGYNSNVLRSRIISAKMVYKLLPNLLHASSYPKQPSGSTHLCQAEILEGMSFNCVVTFR